MNLLVVFGIRLLEGMFLVGIVLAALVLVLATAEDVVLMFEKDVPEGPADKIDGGGPAA